MNNTMGKYISDKGLKQLRLAEPEKYAHVTFFFNGGVEEPYPGEDRILVPSPKVATYDLQPEMSAYIVTDKLVEAIESGKYDLIIMNYANSDMVGHTGVLPAAVKAIEAIDACIGRVVAALEKVDGQMFHCADHGNSDRMIDKATGEPFTAHTTNPVPFLLFNVKKAKGIAEGGRLCDISPTLLDMMELSQPVEMTGKSLLI
jgi:2,3-bisphosphoglycerate-independent phosphoglycerate mutase